jgi:hypothetical protein
MQNGTNQTFPTQPNIPLQPFAPQMQGQPMYNQPTYGQPIYPQQPAFGQPIGPYGQAPGQMVYGIGPGQPYQQY